MKTLILVDLNIATSGLAVGIDDWLDSCDMTSLKPVGLCSLVASIRCLNLSVIITD